MTTFFFLLLLLMPNCIICHEYVRLTRARSIKRCSYLHLSNRDEEKKKKLVFAQHWRADFVFFLKHILFSCFLFLSISFRTLSISFLSVSLDEFKNKFTNVSYEKEKKK